MTVLLVVAGGALGAVARHLAGQVTRWGTLTVNVAGSLLLGLLAGAGSHLPGWVGPLVGAGFCGALTTYSTFSAEVVRMSRAGAVRYAGATLAGGLGGAAAGWALGAALTA